MTTDTNKPAPVAEPASEDCVDTALPTMLTALRAAWEGDYTKSARYVELTATRLEARGQHNQAKWLRIALEEMQGKRQPVVVYAMSVPAPAVDERTPDSGHLAAAPEQQLPEPVAWMHNGYVSKNKGRVLHDEQNNRSCGFKAQPVHALYTADQLRTAIAAERERNPSVQANLARGLLWLAFVWNDHNFEAAHKEARRIAERAGIRSFEDANAWLEAAPAGAGAKGEGE